MPTRRIALALFLLTTGCTDATGTVRGGEALTTSTSGGAATWTALYADFFGPGGQASCSALSTCHGSDTTAAVGISGFVCGSKESCRAGMIYGMVPLNDAGVPVPDAGKPQIPPIVSSGGDPTKTPLYLALHQASTSSDNPLCSQNRVFSCNMPCGDPVVQPGNQPGCHAQVATYTFTQDDLTRISTWIQQGAQDN